VVGRKDCIEKAKEVSVENKTDVAYADLVIEVSRTRLPQSVAVIQVCELLPIGIIVSVGHGERGKERMTGGRCLITQNTRRGIGGTLPTDISTWTVTHFV
jgi:hypothetical protein